MRLLSLLFAATALLAGPAHAADDTLLIQIEANGHYRVWHTQGEAMLNEDELQSLTDSAPVSGDGPRQTTSAGLASAQRTREGVVVHLHERTADTTLLIDRDDCGGVKLWHGDGVTQLDEETLTELVLSALPNGGERLTLDDRLGPRFARAYTARNGVIALLWRPKKR